MYIYVYSSQFQIQIIWPIINKTINSFFGGKLFSRYNRRRISRVIQQRCGLRLSKIINLTNLVVSKRFTYNLGGQDGKGSNIVMKH